MKLDAKKYDALNSSVQENIKGMRVVKSYVREEYEKQKFGAAAADVQRCLLYTSWARVIPATRYTPDCGGAAGSAFWAPPTTTPGSPAPTATA